MFGLGVFLASGVVVQIAVLGPRQSSPLPTCPCSVVLCSFSMYLQVLSVKLSVVLILLLVGVVRSALCSGYR